MAVWKRILVSGSNISDLINNVGYATTGSNTFQGNQTINGDVIITGSLTAQQYIISSSVIYVTESNYSGSHIFGNSLDDTHQFTGSVLITGSTYQVGNNNLLGNTTLSGSIIISGSSATAIDPTVKLYGDVETDGVIKFLPVVKNIDTSISASYIYVSGSTNDLYFTQNGNGYANTTRLRWLEGNLYTGLLNGGVITSQSSTVYQIGSGSGIIVNLNATAGTNPYPTIQYLNWGNLTGTIDALSASFDQQFVAVSSSNGTAVIKAQGTPYVDGDYNTVIPIGIVIHQNHSSINAVQTFPGVAYGWKQRSYDFIRAFGPLKISGYTLAQSGSSTRGLVLSGGTAWVDGRNYIVDPNNPSYITEATGITTSKIYRYHQSGSQWAYDTNGGAGYTDIDPTQYSNNGTLTPVSTNNWTIQRVFYFPNSATKALYIYYGNAQYSNKTDALAAVQTETFTEAPNTAANAIYVGYMLLRHNADFTVAASYVFSQAGLFRSSGTGGGGSGGGVTTLAALTDTSITSPTYGDLLMYDSTYWYNTKTLSGSYTLSGSLVTNDGVWVQSLTASIVSASSGITGSLFGTSSWAQSASQALTASYTPNALITASVSTNVLTFTKGDGTTFNLTVNTGSGGGSGTPGGSNTEIQFNSGSSFSGSQYFKYNYVSQSLIQGANNTATGLYSHAEGANNISSGQQSHTEGSFNNATGFASHAEGRQTQATAYASHAEGYTTVASGFGSHAEGESTQASASGSHAEGVSSVASGLYSHAEGATTVASGQYSHAEGYDADSTAFASHAEGWQTLASNTAAHSEGLGTSATASGSHAEGYYTTAAAPYSHAEGWDTDTSTSTGVTIGTNVDYYAFNDNNDTVIANYTSTSQTTYLLWETNQVSGGNRRLWLSNLLASSLVDTAYTKFNISSLDSQGPFGTGDVITGSYVYDLNSRSNSYNYVYTYVDYDTVANTITVTGDLTAIDTSTFFGVVVTIPSIGTQLIDIDTGTGITYDGGLDLSTIPLGTVQTSINNDLPALSGTYSGGTIIFTTIDSGTGWGSYYEGQLLTSSINLIRHYDAATSSSKINSALVNNFLPNSYANLNNTTVLIESASTVGSETTLFFKTDPFSGADQFSQFSITKGWASHAEGSNTLATGTGQTVVGVFNSSNYDSLFLIGDGYELSNRHNVVDVRRGLVTIDGNTTITGSVNITGSLLINGSAPGGSGTPLATLVQSTPSNSWTFNHSLGVTNPIVTVYDSNNKVIIPQEISASNSNTLIITFPTTLTGTAVAAGGTYVGTTPTNAVTASYALLANTASYALTAGAAATASYVSGYATLTSNTFTGNQTISGSITFGLPTSPAFNGEIVKFGSGTLTTGLLYFLSSSGTWSLADASATGSSIYMLGIAVGSSPTANGLLIRGFAASSSYSYGTGSIVYMQTGSGVMTATAPTGSNQVVRVMGYQTTTANTIYFDPDKTWVTLA